jgi:hypothetical protein
MPLSTIFQLYQDYFQEKVPLQHLDFTTVLPAFLSLYIFTFLEPKSLCRAAQACWHWKFLTEQVIYNLFLSLESINLSHNGVSSTRRHELTTLEVIGTDCTGSCKSN